MKNDLIKGDILNTIIDSNYDISKLCVYRDYLEFLNYNNFGTELLIILSLKPNRIAYELLKELEMLTPNKSEFIKYLHEMLVVANIGTITESCLYCYRDNKIYNFRTGDLITLNANIMRCGIKVHEIDKLIYKYYCLIHLILLKLYLIYGHMKDTGVSYNKAKYYMLTLAIGDSAYIRNESIAGVIETDNLFKLVTRENLYELPKETTSLVNLATKLKNLTNITDLSICGLKRKPLKSNFDRLEDSRIEKACKHYETTRNKNMSLDEDYANIIQLMKDNLITGLDIERIIPNNERTIYYTKVSKLYKPCEGTTEWIDERLYRRYCAVYRRLKERGEIT